MTRRARLIALTVLSVGIAGAWISAQAVMPRPVVPPVTISGADLAFRVEATRGGTVVGRLMVRMNGEWLEADVDGGMNVRRLHTK